MKTSYTEVIERYYDCPYCGETITDRPIFSQIDIETKKPIEEGKTTCPNCNKKLILER